MDEGLLGEVRAHDAQLAQCGVEIWIGSEPTFTQPWSQQACWLTDAEGGEKRAYAQALLTALAPRLPGPVQLLRVEGRRYPGEKAPRFCLGALFNRYGAAYAAPPDTSQLESEELTATPTTNAQQAWLTVTPDPGVVEVNMAPGHDLETFARWAEDIFMAAAETGLSTMRLRFNGEVTDSGGGGQLTLGGPSPEQSPFFVHPELLPGLVRYLNRHPSLSYLFAPDVCGSASQGPRADETVRERFEELPIALDYLVERGEAATPEELWGMLAPLLVDATHSSHRAEINVEKLYNPWLPERGRLGLVELRSLRMPKTAAHLTAIAALFRALAARLAVHPYREPIIDWGAQLHDRFGLPWFLEEDFASVLADLDAHGFGIGPGLRALLLERPEPVAVIQLGDASLELRRAINFWPLIGDLASQEGQTSRLVDSSSVRLQALVRAPAGTELGELTMGNTRVELRTLPNEASPHAALGLGSVRYRAFVPQPGLHPAIPAVDPLVLEWSRGDEHVRIALHGWRPDGGAYDGLPPNETEARRRRAERVVTTPCNTSQ